MRKEYYCGRIGEADVGRRISVFGWVHTKRELGGLTFIDLRDREGILQVVVNERFENREIVKRLGREDVVAVSGEVQRRSAPNPALPTGQVELAAQRIDILAAAELPPFFPDGSSAVSDELRFKHRYIDLRNPRLQKNFRLRSQAALAIRNDLAAAGFVEIETPVLTKPTPEGARDYLVPSRVFKGRMFALPQSPQLLKQLLMVAGFERYFQIVKCFRDEDLRADRQPEFTQVDVEMSFSEPDELFAIIEALLANVFALAGLAVQGPFRRITYADAMGQYGSDKPDLRIPFTIRDVSGQAAALGSAILDPILTAGGRVKAVAVPDNGSFSRKRLEEVNAFVKASGGAGVMWMRKSVEGFKASVKVSGDAVSAFFSACGFSDQEVVFLVAGEAEPVLSLAGKLRQFLGEKFTIPGVFAFCWVVDFPLFFFNTESNRLDSQHHPFTAPRPEDVHLLESDPLRVRSLSYDLVLNGTEISSGSQRIHAIALQHQIFRLLRLSEADIEEKFGFFLNALRFGAPPHLGIALGFDRIMMLLCGESSIREVIAFPKTTSSFCPLTGSPSAVSDQQLDELGIARKP